MNFTKMNAALLLGAASLCLSSAVVYAQTTPSLSGEVVLELQNEYTVDSDDPTTDDFNNLFFRTEVAPTLQFNENWFIDGVLVWEDINDRSPSRSNFLDNEGAFIEEIKLNYQNGRFGALAGKLNPLFGLSWDFGRGIWTEDFAEDYEITERIGVGVNYDVGNAQAGSHVISANSFFADTTFLSSSVVTKRDRTSEEDGGVSNTEDFSSFVVSIEGQDIPSVPNLYYQLAYRDQAEGDADTGTDTDRERGYVGVIGYVQPVTEDVEVDLLLEYADINNFETADQDNTYFTATAVTTIQDAWNVTVGYTSRDIDGAGVDADDHLFQISGGYDFGQGTTAELGWRNAEESGIDTDIIGGLIRHTVQF